MHSGVNDYSPFDAVLLIGDEALKANKSGLPDFELVYDLAKEWYDWKKLPFVFAVWAYKKNMDPSLQHDLQEILKLYQKTAFLLHGLKMGEEHLETIGFLHGEKINLSKEETTEYLQGFNYRLGEREKEAMKTFKKLIEEIKVTT